MATNIGWTKLSDVSADLKEIPAQRVFAAGLRPFADFDANWTTRHSQAFNADIVTSARDGARFALRVQGDAVGLNLTRHEYSGNLEITVNGESRHVVELYAVWRDWLPTVLIISGLGEGSSELAFRISGKNGLSRGSECWVRSLLVSQQTADLLLPRAAPPATGVMDLPKLENCINLHARRDRNVGDQRSSPVGYFPFLADVAQHDLFDWNPRFNASYAARLGFYEALETKNLIIGGGGLLETAYFSPALEFIRYGARGKSVIWGAGHNLHEPESWVAGYNKYSLSVINYDLIGVRDYGTRFRWVPCASCMAPELLNPPPASRDLGFFLHAVVEETKRKLLREDPDIPYMDNFGSFADAVGFIAGCETLVTNSFHGAYWALLMGRRVIGIPTASKFFSLKHPIAMADIADWRSALPRTAMYSEALGECREANIAFAYDVHGLLSA
jgi:hypothetical protein